MWARAVSGYCPSSSSRSPRRRAVSALRRPNPAVPAPVVSTVTIATTPRVESTPYRVRSATVALTPRTPRVPPRATTGRRRLAAGPLLFCCHHHAHAHRNHPADLQSHSHALAPHARDSDATRHAALPRPSARTSSPSRCRARITSNPRAFTSPAPRTPSSIKRRHCAALYRTHELAGVEQAAAAAVSVARGQLATPLLEPN